MSRAVYTHGGFRADFELSSYRTKKKQEGWDAGWSFENACQAEIIPAFLGRKAASHKQADWNGGLSHAREQAYGGLFAKHR